MRLFDYLKNKLARGPAITGTTNTLAKHYLMLKESYPTLMSIEIYSMVIKQRYKLLPIIQAKQQVLESKITNNLKFRDFVIWVLNVETELGDSGSDFISKVMSVIEKELKKYKGLPN